MSKQIYAPSQADFSLSTTKVPFKPDRLESQIPVEEAYPTHDPAKFIRGAAQDRHWDVEGPVQVSHAGEHLLSVTIEIDLEKNVLRARGGCCIPILTSLTGLRRDTSR
jgi:hypothetical protein